MIGKIPLGISQCLLGDSVRFDGSHKRNSYLTDVLADYVEFRPICPEMAIGLGVPRKPIRLIMRDGRERICGVENSEQDVTDALMQEAERTIHGMPDICGYVFTQRSPSCGIYTVKRYNENGYLVDSNGRGAYAKQFMERAPLIPVEEDERLNDADVRENFLIRIFALYDWRQSVAAAPTAKKLIDFYSRYKYQVMAHHVPGYVAIGKLLGNLSLRSIEVICNEFIFLLMSALSHKASRKGNVNVLMHLRGYLKKHIDQHTKAELSKLIESYAQGIVPLAVPLKLLEQQLMTLDSEYLKHQTFLAPYPEALSITLGIQYV